MKPRSKKEPLAAITPPDETTADFAHQQEQAREEAWSMREEGLWNDQPLKPWSRERDALFVRLTEKDEGGYDLAFIPRMIALLQSQTSPQRIEQTIDPLLYIEQASLVLYLASHEPEAWDHLRGRRSAFLRVANAWAEVAIQLGQEWQAIHTAVSLITAHRQMIAIRRPSAGSGAASGN
jgi:hypothetical protein